MAGRHSDSESDMAITRRNPVSQASSKGTGFLPSRERRTEGAISPSQCAKKKPAQREEGNPSPEWIQDAADALLLHGLRWVERSRSTHLATMPTYRDPAGSGWCIRAR